MALGTACAETQAEPEKRGAGAGAPGGAGPPVEIAAVREAEVRDVSDYVAKLRSQRSIEVQPLVTGHVSRILVASGDRVEAGERLVEIEPDVQQARVETQRAQRNAAVARVELARKQKARTAELLRREVATAEEVDQAAADLKAAQAELRAIDAQVKEQRVTLGYYFVSAPEGGIVGDLPMHVGDRVDPSTTLTTVDQNAVLEVHVEVPVERAAALSRGQVIELLDQTGQVLAVGKASFVAARVDAATQSVLVKAPIDNTGRLFRAEQRVTARVVWGVRKGPVIPIPAVVRQGAQAFAVVAARERAGRVARLRPITLGPMQGNVYAVERGLQVGDEIVVAGTQKVRDGVPLGLGPPPSRGARKAR